MPVNQPDPLNPDKKLYTYEGDERRDALPDASAVNLEAITGHIEMHIGPVGSVFHEIVSDQVHLDVILVPPTDAHPEWTLVTSGMSDLPMKHGGTGKPAYLELLIRLDKNWPVNDTDEEWKKEKNFWPIKLLKFIAHLPHKYGAFIWTGHTLDNGQPAKPWSDAAPAFKGVFLAPSRTLPKEFEILKLPGQKQMKFLAIYPAYLEETQFARREGAEALWNKFVEQGVTDVINPARPSALGTKPEARRASFWDRLRGR